MMKRRTLAGLTVGVVVLSSGLGWVAASRIRSPAEVAARTAPPPASPILVPVEERVLSTDIVTRGTGRFGAPKQITLPPSGLKPDPSLVTTLPLVGAELAEGDVILTTSGRPVFLLSGSRPSFRDLGPGIGGYDVQQLEEALVRLGFDPGPVDGTYDTQTEAAVSAWYTGAGFAAIKATDAQVAVIRVLEQDLSTAQLDVLGAKDRVATAEADLIAAQAAHTAAVSGGDTEAAVALAQREADAANTLAAAEVAAKQLALDDISTVKVVSPAEIHAAVWLSPRYSRSRSARCQASPMGLPGRPHETNPANSGRPSGRSPVHAWSSSSVARSRPSGSGPRIRSSCAVAPSLRAARMVAASVSDHPTSTRGTTIAGLNTAKADATTSPGTWPRMEPRLVK